MDRECGGRDKATCERLLERLRRGRTRLYCADDYAVYGVLLPVGQLYTGKDETHGIERDNARQRHWLARFRRRSIVVSKAKRMGDVSIALFARFAGNAKIGDLISMLTENPHDGSFTCRFRATGPDRSFEISARGKPTYALSVIEPGVASGFVNFGSRNVSLPGCYVRSRNEAGCWMNESAGTKLGAW